MENLKILTTPDGDCHYPCWPLVLTAKQFESLAAAKQKRLVAYVRRWVDKVNQGRGAQQVLGAQFSGYCALIQEAKCHSREKK
ncbi:MAG: hypothetical protein V1936_00100 [Patescibacteria group bacterium]